MRRDELVEARKVQSVIRELAYVPSDLKGLISINQAIYYLDDNPRWDHLAELFRRELIPDYLFPCDRGKPLISKKLKSYHIRYLDAPTLSRRELLRTLSMFSEHALDQSEVEFIRIINEILNPHYLRSDNIM